jgi:hypothetical protein
VRYRFLEILGLQSPHTARCNQLNEDRIYEWMNQVLSRVNGCTRSCAVRVFRAPERQKKGEVETLLVEAQEAQSARNVDDKTGSSVHPVKAKKPISDS